MSPDEVVAGVRAGSRRAVGRAITMVEGLGEEGRLVSAALHPATGSAARVGLTGPPGVGKSTLCSALVRHLRDEARTVALVSVDPSSPFTRGAVLGDRVRLVDHFLDEGVFIRSMGSRGHRGGLAEATADAVGVLDAAGYDVVLIETVGAGQNEVEVRSLADTVVLVLMPGSGDSIQAIKAGLMEIPDVIAVNKADRPGADLLRAELESALTLVPGGDWPVPIVMTRAVEGDGADELWRAVERHRAHLIEDGRLRSRRCEGLARRLRGLALERVARRLAAGVSDAELAELAARVEARTLDPGAAVDAILARAGGGG